MYLGSSRAKTRAVITKRQWKSQPERLTNHAAIVKFSNIVTYTAHLHEAGANASCTSTVYFIRLIMV